MRAVGTVPAFMCCAVLAQSTYCQNFTNSIGIELVRIEPGAMQVAVFHTSCPNESDFPSDIAPQFRWTAADYSLCEALVRRASSPGFRVTINRPFYIGKFEITQAQFL